MLKVFDQEVLSDHKKGTFGDCTRACVRTLVQSRLVGLPHPIDCTGEDWNDGFWSYIEDHLGLYIRLTPCRADKDYSFLPRVVMAGGPTLRTGEDGKPRHMVIWDREANACLHDPHPSRAGLTKVETFYWFEEQQSAVAH